MIFSTLSKVGFATLLGASLFGTSIAVQAGTPQDSIFGNVEPALRERMFFRLNAISATVKTTASDVRDVNGPVVSITELETLRDNGSNFFSAADGSSLDYTLGVNQLLGANGISRQAAVSGCASIAQGLGSPCGLKARGANHLNTLALSVGYFLDEDYKWALEAMVLSAPLKVSIYGEGNNWLNGKEVMNTKLLPPIVSLGRYFGNAKDSFRPYVGAMASYAMFFDSRATSSLNTYVGAASPNDTTISIKNSFGVGPMIGFKYQHPSSNWQVSLNVGNVRYKTDATIVTHNTVIKSNTPVLNDYGAYITNAIVGGNNAYTGSTNGIVVDATGQPAGKTAGDVVPLTEALMCDLAFNKSGSTSCNLGTYVRKTTTVLDNTLFMLSVGRSF